MNENGMITNDMIEDFKKISEIKEKDEPFRGMMWYRARKLLEDGYKIEAYILILATWNFARFRYFMTKFDFQKFKGAIEKVQPIFDKLKNETFKKADFDDRDLQNDIKNIYINLKSIVEQTGAAKIMALTNPNLFIMWDTNIRKKYKINNSASPEDYIQFITMMQNKFKHIEWNNDKKPFAKAIDEWNHRFLDKYF